MYSRLFFFTATNQAYTTYRPAHNQNYLSILGLACICLTTAHGLDAVESNALKDFRIVIEDKIIVYLQEASQASNVE